VNPEQAAAAMQREDWPGAWLRDTLDYQPRDLRLFKAALTHRSATGSNNERLEFLGDAVLNMVAAEQLYLVFPAADEGALSRLRARVVSSQPLAEVGAELGLGDVLLLGAGELKSGGFRRESILADATEALIGAVYLDAGLDAARSLVLRLLGGRIAALDAEDELKDAKTLLQELLQSRNLALPTYVLQRVEGEPHEQSFLVRCEVAFPDRGRLRIGGQDMTGQRVIGTGQGSSRRRAEQAAAQIVLAQLLATSTP
jgi:ribonuclease-3